MLRRVKLFYRIVPVLTSSTARRTNTRISLSSLILWHAHGAAAPADGTNGSSTRACQHHPKSAEAEIKQFRRIINGPHTFRPNSAAAAHEELLPWRLAALHTRSPEGSSVICDWLKLPERRSEGFCGNWQILSLCSDATLSNFIKKSWHPKLSVVIDFSDGDCGTYPNSPSNTTI